MRNKIKKINKPWGKELWFAQDKSYLGKILIIKKGHRLSKQYHRFKHETLYCSKGKCLVEFQSKRVWLKTGQCVDVKPRVIHRLCAPSGDVELFEVSTCHPNDVIRCEDDYGREQ